MRMPKDGRSHYKMGSYRYGGADGTIPPRLMDKGEARRSVMLDDAIEVDGWSWCLVGI